MTPPNATPPAGGDETGSTHTTPDAANTAARRRLHAPTTGANEATTVSDRCRWGHVCNDFIHPVSVTTVNAGGQ